jgi:hypothetical protein
MKVLKEAKSIHVRKSVVLDYLVRKDVEYSFSERKPLLWRVVDLHRNVNWKWRIKPCIAAAILPDCRMQFGSP